MRAKGEGTIQRLGDKKYVWLGYYTDIEGKKKRKALYAKTKKEVIDKWKKWAKKIEETRLCDNGNMTVKTWGERWLSLRRNKLKIKTQQQYETYLKTYVYPYIGTKAINKVTAMELQELLNKLSERLAPDTVAGVRNRLVTLFGTAVKFELLHKNIAEDTLKPKVKRMEEIDVFSEDEIKKILKQAQEDTENEMLSDQQILLYQSFNIFINLMFFTGCREMEALGAKPENIDLQNGIFKIRQELVVTIGIPPYMGTLKTKNSVRNVPIPVAIIPLLQKWEREKEAYKDKWENIYDNKLNLLIPNSVGGPMLPSNVIKRFWKPLLEKCGVKYRNIHVIRHHYVSYLISKGVDIMLVSKLAGHSSVSFTMSRYGHIMQPSEQQNKAIKVLDTLLMNDTQKVAS